MSKVEKQEFEDVCDIDNVRDNRILDTWCDTLRHVQWCVLESPLLEI